MILDWFKRKVNRQQARFDLLDLYDKSSKDFYMRDALRAKFPDVDRYFWEKRSCNLDPMCDPETQAIFIQKFKDNFISRHNEDFCKDRDFSRPLRQVDWYIPRAQRLYFTKSYYEKYPDKLI